MAALTPLKVALDWTPNTNHVGFYLAKAKGWYKDAGLDVTFRSPHTDEYKTTPASHVQYKTADFAMTPTESVISHHTWPGGSKPKLVALAALVQGATDAVVTLADSGLDRPAKLDGKTYASYAARFEGRIVQQLIRNDGGSGDFKETTPPMLGIWETLLKGEADATWVFMGWEGIEAELKGVKLNVFRLADYKVAYGYSPLLVAHPDSLEGDKAEAVRKFLAATARGYEHAAENPADAAEAFLAAVEAEHREAPLPTPLQPELVKKSLEFLSKHFLNSDGQWGVQDPSKWSSFVDWLCSSALLTTKVQSTKPEEGVSTTLDGLRQGDVGDPIPRDQVKESEMFSNAFLPGGK